jgi:FeoB-associated Cys-rich membrane protein
MMDVQLLIVALVVLAAGVFVGNKVRRTVLSARAANGRGKGCGGDCGCSH